ncbi:hypothetical protein [Marinimicrobium sp. ARAG 43.8]|uniref:hypothetical protein n=1 Tax=Marinimicrobium sp. ARAG 43.8 TaxID=3418719 RepID=UPI003CEF3A39
MNLIRTDLQTALHDLYTALEESADHYYDAADFVESATASQLFKSIAQERDQLADALERVIRDSGDMPAPPNDEKEAGEQLLHRLHSFFSADQTADVIEQRLEAEARLDQVLKDNRALDTGAPYAEWDEKVSRHVVETRRQLERARSQSDAD